MNASPVALPGRGALNGIAVHYRSKLACRLFPAGPACAFALAGLLSLGRINPEQANGSATHCQRVAIDHDRYTRCGLRKCRRRQGCKQKGNSQLHDPFRRIVVVIQILKGKC